MIRLMLHLVCNHNLAYDPVEGEQFPSNEFCPGCGLWVSVIGYDHFEDADL